MIVKLHPKQHDIFKDKHRFKVAVCGRRFGKTTLAITICIYEAMEEKSQVWYVAPSYRMAKQIAWEMLNETMPREAITKANETELTIYLKNGSKIALKGADNPDSLRGVGLDYVVLDEYADIKQNVWEEIIRPTLLDTGGKALFIGTPKGYNHFYEMFNKDDPSWKSWQFKSADNPFISKEEMTEARRTTTDDYFAQEYEADFRKHTGLIYKEFDREIHIIDPIDLPNTYYMYRAIDFGDQNPTAVNFILVSPDDDWYLIDELNFTRTSISEMSGIIKAKTDFYIGKGYPLVQTWGDPSGTAMMREYETFSIYITPAIKEVGDSGMSWVKSGIEKIREKFKINQATHKPKLFIFKRCVNTIEEFEKYRWKEKTAGNEDINYPSVPEKAFDHHMDALRYFAVSYFSPDMTAPELTGTRQGLGGAEIDKYNI